MARGEDGAVVGGPGDAWREAAEHGDRPQRGDAADGGEEVRPEAGAICSFWSLWSSTPRSARPDGGEMAHDCGDYRDNEGGADRAPRRRH